MQSPSSAAASSGCCCSLLPLLLLLLMEDVSRIPLGRRREKMAGEVSAETIHPHPHNSPAKQQQATAATPASAPGVCTPQGDEKDGMLREETECEASTKASKRRKHSKKKAIRIRWMGFDVNVQPTYLGRSPYRSSCLQFKTQLLNPTSRV